MDNLKQGLINLEGENQLKEWGFTVAELKQLGLVATSKFESVFGTPIGKYSLKRFYRETIGFDSRSKELACWLLPRLNKYIELNIPLRIYVGGSIQFINRGDEYMELSLRNLAYACGKYCSGEEVKVSQISSLIYYLNLMI